MMKTDASSKPRTYIGWDIGGAHLKAAQLSSDGNVAAMQQVACPLWHGIDELEQAYQLVCKEMPISSDTTDSLHIVTMTGELADSFTNRTQGVRAILDAMQRLLGQPFEVYASDKGILNHHAVSDIESVASKNWQATAEWSAMCCEEGILIDIGSTTTDLVPFKSGRVQVKAYDDAARMRYGELIYAGISRTPVMAIADHFDINGVNHPIAAENFATIADVYRILEELSEDSDLYPTCDNAAKTIAASARRLERMFGLDWAGDLEATFAKARAIADMQQQKISCALGILLKRTRLSDRACVVGAGAGYKIVQCIAERLGLRFMPYHCLLGNLPEHLEENACRCASAVSVASLACQKHLQRYG